MAEKDNRSAAAANGSSAGQAAAPVPAGAGKPRGGKGWLASRPWHVRAAILAPAYGVLLLVIGVSALLIHYTIRFPDPRALRINQPAALLRILARDGSVLAERGERNEFVPLDQLPRHLVDAVVAIEDRRFYSHFGLDPSGLVRAAFANLRAGRTTQGGSTLTQQLAKNLFLSTDRTMSRKLEELVLSLWLEVRMSKREILELYLNRVYLGGGAFGVEAAAQRFFNKSARTVTLGEAAVIAGLLKAPSKYSPFVNPGFARARARVVLGAMEQSGMIGQVAHAAAMRQSVHFADPAAGHKATGLEYAVDYVLDQIPPLANAGMREIVVETTIDADLQKRAQSEIARTIAEQGQTAGVGQAALVLLDTGGGIRALVGGRSWAESQFNRAVKARRQPGSAFKPFVYLAALENGMGPDYAVTDAPIDIGGWSPRNDDGRYRGQTTLRNALAHSINTVAVRLQSELGAERVAAVARRLGIASKLRTDASMALGTSEVGVLELTGAYAELAAGGQAVDPYAVVRIRTGGGEILFERHKPKPELVVTPDVVGQMNSMLNAVVVSGTGRRAALARHQAAGKTGTTQDFRDAWFVGYTAHLVCGVWFGNDDGRPMSRVMGGGLPARVWHDIMTAAHDGLAPRPLPATDPAGERDQPAAAGEPGPPAAPLRSPAVAMPVAASVAPPRQAAIAPPIARAGLARTVPPARPTPLRLPSEPIDPAFFARVLEASPPAAASPAGTAGKATAAGFDAGRIREALGGAGASIGARAPAGGAGRMGLGAAQ